MAKTPPAKPGKTARRSGTHRNRTSAPRTIVKGSVSAGRDVVMGNQTNYVDNRQQIAKLTTPREFMAELRKVREAVAALRRNPKLTSAETRRIEVVEADVQEVIAEVQKPKPLANRINATLDNAKTTMEKLGENIKAAVGLGGTLAALAQLAMRLFGS